MQTARQADRGHRITMTSEQGPQLVASRLVRSARQANKDTLAQAQDVSAVEGPGRVDEAEFTISRHRLGNRLRFGPAGFGPGTGHHGELIQYDTGILDEHRIRKFGGDRQALDNTTKAGQTALILS